MASAGVCHVEHEQVTRQAMMDQILLGSACWLLWLLSFPLKAGPLLAGLAPGFWLRGRAFVALIFYHLLICKLLHSKRHQ